MRKANISRKQYSDIMDRWQEPDMMEYRVPVYHKDETRSVNGEEVPVFYWIDFDVNLGAGKKVIGELDKLGIKYNG